MLLLDLALAPYRAARVVVRLAGELDDFADRVRREEDPFSRLSVVIRDGLEDLDALAHRADALDAHLLGLDTHALTLLHELNALIATARELIMGGGELTATAQELDATAKEIVVGGRDLTQTATHLDANAETLNALAASLDETLRLFRAVLPQLLQTLDTVEELEESLETVAETIEPLQKTAEKVGRVTDRFSRS